MKKGRRTDTDMWVRKVRNWEVEEWGGVDVERNREAMHERRRERGVWGGMGREG